MHIITKYQKQFIYLDYLNVKEDIRQGNMKTKKTQMLSGLQTAFSGQNIKSIKRTIKMHLMSTNDRS